MASRFRSPQLLLVPVRVLLFTLLAALLSFAVSLLLGILGIVVLAEVRGAHLDLTFAYRHVALPVAIAAAILVLILASVVEIRQYLRAKSLANIERMSY